MHVPYKGEGPLTPDLVAGRVHTAILSNPSGYSLAVLLDNRSPILPDVPTTIEAGVPEVSLRHRAGVFGPPGMTGEIVTRLNREIGMALKKPEVIERLLLYGYAVEGSSPARLLEINRDDLALWRRLVAQAGIALD